MAKQSTTESVLHYRFFGQPFEAVTIAFGSRCQPNLTNLPVVIKRTCCDNVRCKADAAIAEWDVAR